MHRITGVVLASLVLFGGFSLPARAGFDVPTINLGVNVFSESGDALNNITPGDLVHFQVAVSVNDNSSQGLAQVVYNVVGAEAVIQGYELNQMQDAFSGYRTDGSDVLNPPDDGPAVVSEDYYAADANNTIGANYGGGWGFNRAGLPGGGTVTAVPGEIEAAGATAPLTWTADNHPLLPGFQPQARQGVGVGLFTFGADDPVLGGEQGGFGFQENVNAAPTPGGGEWIIQESVIDTSEWVVLGKYTFDLEITAAAVYDPTLDYEADLGGGFRLDVLNENRFGTSFQFTLVPEPSTLGVLMIAGLALIRRRKH